MKTKIIPAIAFTLGFCGALISYARPNATVIYGYSATARCLEGSGPIESQCTTSNTGAQCTVILPSGEGAPAFTTKVSMLTCAAALKQP